MGLYRAKSNVKDSDGVDVLPGDLARLTETDAVKLAAFGAIEPVAVAGTDVLGPDDRLTALSGFIPNLMIGDMSEAGALSPEGSLRIEQAIGFVPTVEELRAAGEAFFAKRATTAAILDPLMRQRSPGGFQSSDPMLRLHGEAAAASPTTEANVRAESSGMTAQERQAALLAAAAALAQADFTGSGALRVDARRRLATQLGFEFTDDEIRAAIEAAKAAPPAG